MTTTTQVCCTHCVHTLSDALKKQGELQIEGQPQAVIQAVIPTALPNPIVKKEEGLLSGISSLVGRVASVFVGSSAPKLVESSCSTLAMKSLFSLKDITAFPNTLKQFYSTLSDTITLPELKNKIIEQFTVGTLSECGTCFETAKGAFFTLPSNALLAACVTDMVASELFGLLFGSSWLTFGLQTATSFYASSYFCGNTFGEAKELLIGYTAYRVLSGVWRALSGPSKK